MSDRRVREVHCIVPAAPELMDRIVRSKSLVQVGEKLPARATGDLLDGRTLNLIMRRPPRTPPNTFVGARPDAAPATGTRRALVLLIDFSDQAATRTPAHYADMLFSVDSYSTGSMRDFFREASYAQLDVVGLVSGAVGPTRGWYRAPRPKSFYTNGRFGFGRYPRNAQQLVEDAIALAEPHVDFADYDNDGDGVVDALAVICAGSGAEQTGNVHDIWSHKWDINAQTRDGVTISHYFMTPEDGRVGVTAHELGHLLMAWPDLYDTDYSSAGTGSWDLMAAGSWNGGGDTPAHPSCWCKTKAGWVDATVVWNCTARVDIPPHAVNGVAYKLPIGSVSSEEYFLVTNRQRTGFDSGLPGEGLIIEHVDEAKNNNTDEDHYLVDIEQADGRRDLNLNANRGDATDPFPTSTNRSFTASSNPNSNAYSGRPSKVSVTNIARCGDRITALVNVGGRPRRRSGTATAQSETSLVGSGRHAPP